MINDHKTIMSKKKEATDQPQHLSIFGYEKQFNGNFSLSIKKAVKDTIDLIKEKKRVILTSSQIEEVLRILDRYQAVFISHNVGVSVLSEYDKSILRTAGIDLSKIKTIGGVEQAFKFGMLSGAIGDSSKLMSYASFKKHLASGITSYEEQVLESLKRQTYNDVTKQFERVKGNVREKLVFADKELNTVLHSKSVTDAAILNITIIK